MELIVRRDGDDRGANGLLCGQFKDAAEIAGSSRRTVRRISFGKPDPFRPVKWIRLFALIPADPFSLPVTRVKQAHAPGGGRAPVRGRAIFIPSFDLPETLCAGRQWFAPIGDID